MFLPDLMTVSSMVEERRQKTDWWAENCWLLCQATTRKQTRLLRPPRLLQPACLLLCHLGRMLVALGLRLEAYGPPRSVPIDGHLGSGS